MTDVAVVLVGAVIGLLVGATGVGAGTLGAPFLIFALRVDPFTAVGTDLFMNFVIKIAGSLLHRRADNVDVPSLVPLCISAVAGSMGGIAFLAMLKSHGDATAARAMLRHVIGAVIVVCAAAIALSSRLRAPHERFDRPGVLAGIGGIVAALTAITGVGVGSLSVPALYFVKGRAKAATVVGTSLVYAAAVTAVSAAGQMGLGDVNYPLAGLLLGGALPGVVAGSALATRAPDALRPLLVVVLVVSGLRLVF
jgi:uncharacterized membrane protein YfcA